MATDPEPVPRFSKVKFSILNSVDVAVFAIVIESTLSPGHPPVITVSNVSDLYLLNSLASFLGP